MHLREIPGLEALWGKTLGSSSVCVAVLDGPVDLKHPCFEGANIEQVETLVCNTPDGGAASQHGTFVASILFGRHDGPVTGIVPNCRGLIIPVFASGVDGRVIPCSQVDLARAILQAAQAGANVINVSGGEYSASGEAYPLLADAVRFCAEAGVLIVSAAGNDGCECLHIPGALPSVLAVGAMGEDESPLDFSNWGRKYREQGVLALGMGIVGASPGGGSTVNGGTSIATAVVSGVVALLMSLQVGRSQKIDVATIRQVIFDSARGCDPEDMALNCQRLLVGRLNVTGAVSLLLAEQENELVSVNEVSPSPSLGRKAILPSSSGFEVKEAAVVTPDVALIPIFDGANELSAPSFLLETQVNPSSEVSSPHELVKEATPSAGIVPSAGCGGCTGSGNGVAPQKVFALGKLSFDYGSRARRSYFADSMQKFFSPPPPAPQRNPHIDDPAHLIRYLRSNDKDASYQILEGKRYDHRTEVVNIIWTLMIDETPTYAIVPNGPFAFEIHDTLIGFLVDQLPPAPPKAPETREGKSQYTAPKADDHLYGEGAERVSIAGMINGQIRLFTGDVVPIIVPDQRGMFSWRTDALAVATLAASGANEDLQSRLDELLNRIYFETRNLGVTSGDRALNYAVTNALQLEGAMQNLLKDPRFAAFELDTFEVEKSPICRPEADCWDVKLLFYNPTNLMTARRVIRFTVDVSDVVPVMVGQKKEWFTR